MNSSNKHLFTFADAGGFEGFQAHTNAFSPGLDFSAPVLCPPDNILLKNEAHRAF